MPLQGRHSPACWSLHLVVVLQSNKFVLFTGADADLKPHADRGLPQLCPITT